jgi:magnesium transporter
MVLFKSAENTGAHVKESMSVPAPPSKPSPRVRVVLSTTALLSFMSVSKATALAFAELGIAAFFSVGIVRSLVGESAPWFVLIACIMGAFVRMIDIEGWAFFIPGGLIGRAGRAYGSRAAGIAAATVLTERLLLVAIACVLCGQYAVSFGAAWIAKWSVTARLTVQELVVLGAIILIGLLWSRYRIGILIPSPTVAKSAWFGIGGLITLIVLAAITSFRQESSVIATLRGTLEINESLSAAGQVLNVLTGLALVLPVVGSGDALARAAHEFAPPRLRALRRTTFLVVALTFLITALSAFAFVALVPPPEGVIWASTPLSGLTQHLLLPAWAIGVMVVLVLVATLLILLTAAHAGFEDTEQLLTRLSTERILAGHEGEKSAASRRPTSAINLAAAATILVTFVSGAQVAWLSRAYGISIAITVLLKLAIILRLRRSHHEPSAYIAPLNVWFRRRAFPIGPLVVGLVVALSALAMLVRGDIPSYAGLGLIGGLGIVMATGRGAAPRIAEEEQPFELSTAPDISLGQVQVRPDNVIVCVRHPHSLAHVVGALQEAGDRDVVIVTVRILGIDADEETGGGLTSTREERNLFSRVAVVTEQYVKPVRFLIVPAHDVVDGIIAVAVRLHSSEVHVGESSSLSAHDQGRLLGEAWERAEKPKDQHLRLVVHRDSGRTDSYHVGAHVPSLTPNDLDLIHRVWLDVVKSVGPHVHHHDVVRAALTQMEQQLSGSNRDEALAVIQNVARPADELAAAAHARDYSRLRDLLRNRHSSDLAAALTELDIEDQVIVFRILPRKDSGAVFAYLSHEQQEALLKAMAREDVALLLNSMAPDDRTMFLEELPASVTRQLLSLLTPAERSVALTLLGYPADSIGRLMTPHYISVHEDWTVKEVLDYIRTHGQDSETLNVVYVTDDQGSLVDDIRIREFLLTSLDSKVTDLMDRRFVALKASDNQNAAVAVFRQYDRTALPVTDTAGVLIGIVTIDDVLDVAEAAATKEIQRIGGSEAFDEPYMKIGFGSLIRKRAGWLTALFLGEMLTATAMGVFEAEISRAVVLALFVPLIISSGGNSGSQASTLVIRALALGEVTIGDWWRVVRREVLAGLTLGGILGAIGFLRISIWSAFSDIYGQHWLLVALTVGLALIGIVLWGTVVGSILPFVLRRLGFDPATSSAPFVATLVDVTGLVIYFTVAMVVLRGTLL